MLGQLQSLVHCRQAVKAQRVIGHQEDKYCAAERLCTISDAPIPLQGFIWVLPVTCLYALRM
jgi:hypothetical protein